MTPELYIFIITMVLWAFVFIVCFFLLPRLRIKCREVEQLRKDKEELLRKNNTLLKENDELRHTLDDSLSDYK